MKLIEIWIMALLALSSGKECDIGTRITDWYAYTDNNLWVETYHIDFDNDDEARHIVGYFIMQNGDNVLFFYNPKNMPHGYCAVIIDN